MKNKIFFLMACLSMTSATSGSQSTPPANPYAKDARSKALEAQKQKMAPEAQQRMDTRAKGRQIATKGGAVVDITTEIKNIIRNAPLSIQQQNPTTVIAILNQVVQGAGIIIRAYGRRKEALQTIVDTNEQILEAAARSYEKIQGLTELLDKLIGPATVQSAVQKIKTSENLSRARKILTIMNPINYLNTFNNFTDSLYITDNKVDRWEKIKEASKSLKEEQARFDDFIALLEIKVLENMMMEYHRIENFTTIKNPVNTKEGTAGYNPDQSTVGYIGVLQTSSETLDKAIAETNKKILEVQNQKSQGGFLNHLRKVVGRDFETQKKKDLYALMVEREKYLKQKQDVDNKIAYYQSMSMSPEEIKAGRADLLAKINDVQARRASKVNIEELAETVMELKGQVLKLQSGAETIGTLQSQISKLRIDMETLRNLLSARSTAALNLKPQPSPVQPGKTAPSSGKPSAAPTKPAYQPASHFYPSTYPTK